MKKRIILALIALSLSKIFCTSQPAGQSSPTPDIIAMVNATRTSLANVIAPSVPPIPTNPTVMTAPATGGISGQLSYPSDFIPPLQVVAFIATNASVYYYVDTPQNQSSYTITMLPAGMYQFVS
jgi:hypothetical protein